MSKKTDNPLTDEHCHIAQYVSLKELANLLSMDRNTVRRIMERLGVPALKLGGCVRYQRDDVYKALAEHTEDTPQDS